MLVAVVRLLLLPLLPPPPPPMRALGCRLGDGTQCLLVIGLRSLSHARICAEVLASVGRSKAAAPVTRQAGAAALRQLNYALTNP